jgi:DNA-nicking Smr family endonuclease
LKKGRNSGGKDEGGQGLWEHVIRSVKPYHPTRRPLPPAASPQKAVKPAPTAKPPALRDSSPPAPKGKGFDRVTETKLRRGQLPLEGTLDLHGMTQAEAFGALQRFVLAAAAAKKRTVLVITGKGRLSEGVLKRMLPLWLEEPALARHLLAVTPAHIKDGGAGAFYLRLRKPKE